jgi:hypothetical protein
MISSPDLDRRTLESIAAFTKKRAERSTFDRIRKKQNDADDIKKWDKELTRAFERFSVCIVSESAQNLPHEPDRSTPCYISTLATRKHMNMNMVSVYVSHCESSASFALKNFSTYLPR